MSVLELAAWKHADEYCAFLASKLQVALSRIKQQMHREVGHSSMLQIVRNIRDHTWNFWNCRVVDRISRPRGLGTLEEHRQSNSMMTLFPFATQATEQVPGASIEKSRVWVINLAAYLRFRPMGGC